LQRDSFQDGYRSTGSPKVTSKLDVNPLFIRSSGLLVIEVGATVSVLAAGINEEVYSIINIRQP
jgi:hypothetical protein